LLQFLILTLQVCDDLFILGWLQALKTFLDLLAVQYFRMLRLVELLRLLLWFNEGSYHSFYLSKLKVAKKPMIHVFYKNGVIGSIVSESSKWPIAIDISFTLWALKIACSSAVSFVS